MATSKRCSTCNKGLVPMYCTGCDGYFCSKDFRTHREGMFTEMDKMVEERNHLQDAINNSAQRNDQQSPLIEQIDKWENMIIKKVKQATAQARQQVLDLLDSKRLKMTTEFKGFSEELASLKESEDYVEHDLTRLSQMISQFKQDLKQSTEPIAIELHIEQSDRINWDSLIYVEEKQTFTNYQQQQQRTIREPQVPVPASQSQLKCGGRACPTCGKCRDWDSNWKRRDGATCRAAHAFGSAHGVCCCK